MISYSIIFAIHLIVSIAYFFTEDIYFKILGERDYTYCHPNEGDYINVPFTRFLLIFGFLVRTLFV
jgi:hypothetical protein